MTPDPMPPAGPSASTTSAKRWLRMLLLLPACYAFTWGGVAFGIAGLVAMGVDYHEAEMALMLLAFLVFVPLFLWAFASAHLLRVALVLAGGAAGLPAAAWGLQRLLLN